MGRTLTLLGWLALLLRPAWGWAHGPAAPGEFIENRGQWDGRVRYAAPVAAGAWLFVEERGLTYALTGGLPDHEPEAGLTGPVTDQLPAHALRVEFVGGRAKAGPVGEEAAPGLRHYLRGAEAEHWASGARAWQQLRYPALWPGIDFVLKANARRELEYDLLLAAGADPRRVRLRYHGAESMGLDPATGQLRVTTSVGELTEYQPQAWQLDPATGQRQPVACAFVLRGTELSFQLGKYDHGRPLTIDPVVQFASYSGSRVETWGFAAANDAAGNLYTAGVVFGPGYPATTGAYQTTFSGNVDVELIKFNTAASGAAARVWATYLGGGGLEFPHSLLVNGRDEVLLLGSTSSANYPTTAGALGRVFRGGPSVAPYGAGSNFVLPQGADMVLTRLSASGGQLRASTYLGGSGTDGLLDALAPAPRLRHNYGDAFRGDLALDGQGNVYVAGVTGSADFPGLAAGGYRGGGTDGIVVSLDSSLRQTNWATALGGTGADAAYSIQRDPASGALYVAGGTTSPDLAGSAGGYRATYAGDVDGFVTRLTAGGAISQSTYLGTSSYDQAFFVRLGLGGQPCVLGQTLGNNWPNLDPLSYGNLFGHQFIQQLSPSLTAAGFATVFGSGRATTDISPTAFEVDCYGRLFAVGWGGGLDPNGGNTQGLRTTPGAVLDSTDAKDFYILQLSDQARALEYASFFGTSADDHVDGGMSRFDPQGTLYQAMCACNQGGRGLPLPPGAHFYATANASPHCDNAAFKLALPATVSSSAGPDTLTVCAYSGPVVLGGSPAGGTWAGAGVSGSLTAGYVFTPSNSVAGTQVLTYISPFTGLCAGGGTRRITVLPAGTAQVQTLPRTFCIVPGGPAPALVPLLATPAGGTWRGPGVGPGATPGSTVFNPALAGTGSHFLSYTLPGGGRCPVVAGVLMTINRIPAITLPPRYVLCATDPPLPLGGAPSGGTWTGPGVTGSMTAGYYFTPSLALVGSHQLLYSVGSAAVLCSQASATVQVIVRAVVGDSARVPADTALCYAGARPFRLQGGTPVGGKWSGPGVTGSVATGFTFTPSALAGAGQYGLRYTGPVQDSTVCPRSAVRVVSLNSTAVSLSIANALLCTRRGRSGCWPPRPAAPGPGRA